MIRWLPGGWGVVVDTGWLIGAMLAARPVGVHARYGTTFADGSLGETGRCWFQTADRWVVEIEGGPVLASTGSASLTVGADRCTASFGPGGPPPNRPPWSLVVPRLALVYGRPADDWSVRETRFVGRTAFLMLDSVERPDLRAEAVVDVGRMIILQLRTPSWTATLTPEPTQHEDLLQYLRGGLNGGPP